MDHSLPFRPTGRFANGAWFAMRMRGIERGLLSCLQGGYQAVPTDGGRIPGLGLRPGDGHSDAGVREAAGCADAAGGGCVSEGGVKVDLFQYAACCRCRL